MKDLTKITTNNNFNYNYEFDYQKILKDIPYYKEWKTIIPIYKGFSDDLKFKIETVTKQQQQQQLLLRISDSKFEKEKMIEFKITQIFNSIELNEDNVKSINISKPIDIGLCNSGKHVWMLLSWVEGDDLNDSLPAIPIDKQYELGLNAGKLLKKFHSISINNYPFIKENNLLETYNRDNVDKRMNGVFKYEKDIENKYRFNGDQPTIDFIKLNLQNIVDENFKIQGNSLILKHNDFHCGNMVLNKFVSSSPSNDNQQQQQYQLGLIDFNRFSIGYGYEEFQKLESFSTEISIPFCVGQIDGYLGENEELTDIFWKSFATFTAVSCVSMILWGERISNAELESMKYRSQRIMKEFNNFNSTIPTWYINYKLENK